MNEEEKEAIGKLKSVINKDTGVISDDIQDDEIEIILHLIEKQQKVMEARLEEIDSLYKMMSAKDERIDNLMEMIDRYNDMQYIRKVEEKYISKDKIRKEIEEIKNCRLSTCDEQINKSLKERYEIEDEICEYFEELLGE